ncbi:MAG: MBL fold metallo-hydrolase [Microthrixaceae bacterium]
MLDAGTGLRAVTPLLDGSAFVGTILLTHLHWDHVQGLPFFAAGDRPDASVTLLMPADNEPAFDRLSRSMSPPHFPIGPDGLLGTWCFDAVEEGWNEIENLRILVREVPHKGGRTFGYRVEDDHGSFAYIPDHLPAADGPARLAALELADEVDVLVHDAQFLAGESAAAANYGHSTMEQAVALAAESGARELVLFHHAPGRTDDAADTLLAEAITSASCPVRLAVEGAEQTPGSTTSAKGRQPPRHGVCRVPDPPHPRPA